MNYYNDFETGNWLRELIKAGLIPDGDVDDRSITDIEPQDLNGFRQCHFFAGIAGWPRAFELAGWNPDEFVWSASLPCQPLSCAGQQRGHEDERHLWPVFFNLVKKCRPPVIFGEQVASADGREWLAGVQTDLETLGYISAAADLPAASVGSPHKRNRLFWVANSTRSEGTRQRQQRIDVSGTSGGKLGNSNGDRRNGQSVRLHRQSGNGQARQESIEITGTSPTGRVADSERFQPQGCESRQGQEQFGGSGSQCFWSNSIAIPCADGKQRRIPVESSLFPLASRIPGRVGLLKGAGNAIIPQVAAEFIKAVMDIT